MTLEVFSFKGATAAHRPALLFIHGAFHGAWCWAEHFLPWFAARGWDAHALSLRGHARTDDPDYELRATLSDYTCDVLSVTKALGRPVVLIGHSMGGVIAQRCLGQKADIAGAALVASSPLRPALSVVLRILATHPVSFVRAQAFGDFRARRRAMSSFFFDRDLDHEARARYVSLLTAEASTNEVFTRAPPTHEPSDYRPVLVVAGKDDWTIPMRDHKALRDAYRAQLVVCPGAHDLMLSLKWEETAKAVSTWLVREFDR